MLQILGEDPHLLAVYKPAGMPVQPDPTGDTDLLTAAAAQLRAAGEADTLHLVHRLDRVVGGVVVLAKDAATAAELSGGIHLSLREYLAVTASPLPQTGELLDLLYKDSRAGKSFVVPTRRAGVKEARLTARYEGTLGPAGAPYYLYRVRLQTGRFHQIRVQFASRGCPLVGDGKYGSRKKGPIGLLATMVEFPWRGQRFEAPTEEFLRSFDKK